jgi:condensin-2 complex subunit G2
MVRVAAVTGVCKVMSIYWEMISATIIKSLISKVILELVWDASSADVRESVIKVGV